MMDTELKRKVSRGSEVKSGESNTDLEDRVKKVTKQLNDKQKELKNVQSALKKKECAEKEFQKSLNDKNVKISELESTNTRLQMMLDHTKELGESKNRSKHLVDAKKTADDVKQPPTQSQKCFYENNGTCREQAKCKYPHPKKTCQDFSKLGSCSQESLCEHRHPRKVCPRLQNTGYCATGDRCHPVEYAYQDLSQNNYRNYKSYYNPNRRFLGLSPHSLHGVAEQPLGRDYWATPPPAGGGQNVRHPQQEQPGQRQHQPQVWGSQMW